MNNRWKTRLSYLKKKEIPKKCDSFSFGGQVVRLVYFKSNKHLPQRFRSCTQHIFFIIKGKIKKKIYVIIYIINPIVAERLRHWTQNKMIIAHTSPVRRGKFFTRCKCYIAGFRFLPICDFIQKTHTWLEKGSIRPDVSLTAVAETMNKMRPCARGCAQGFRVRMQEINWI